jgi:hypothetical protein
MAMAFGKGKHPCVIIAVLVGKGGEERQTYRILSELGFMGL